MAITKISVDTQSNIKHYICSEQDLVGSYPTDCADGSTIRIINYLGKESGFCIYDGEKWVTEQPQLNLNDLVYAENLVEIVGEPIDSFEIDAGTQPVKVVNITIDYNVPQIETATVVAGAGITLAGNVAVEITSDKLPNSPLLFSIAVALDDTASEVAGKIVDVLNLNKELSLFYTVFADDADIILTQIVPSIYGTDVSLNISIENDTCEGLTDDTSSTSTQSPSTSNKSINITHTPRECEITAYIQCYVVPTTIVIPRATFLNSAIPHFVEGLNILKLYTNDGGRTLVGMVMDTVSISDTVIIDSLISGGVVEADVLIIPEATVVEPVSATGILGILGVVIDGETVTIGDDVYEFASDSSQDVGDNIAVDIEAVTVKSTATLTLGANPTVADTMTIGTKVYTFVALADANADGEIGIGVDLPATKLNVVKAILGTDTFNTAHPLISCAGAFAVNDLALTALKGGVAGDAIATTETFASGSNVFVAFAGGADCTAPNAVTALALAITSNATSPVTGVDYDADSVLLTAKIKGAFANEIVIDDTMAHGAFTNPTLEDGVDGTVASSGTILFDASNIYIAVDDCTTAVSNWKKTALSALGQA